MSRFSRVLDLALGKARGSSEIVLAIAVASIVAALIVPLPTWLLDLGLALNLAAAAALLVAALFARDALQVAAFPTLLLITTLFRLAMNVSSTRLALSEGQAGDIIQAFGEFVVRGDYVVGGVIFAILTLVQFLVVTKGAERVAEVGARFTLDAMPGKQMSIDADLRSGAITQEQARSRRRALERESQLFGAMDGAMKFVKGDVIAGLVITAVNLFGGVVIGVLQHDLSISEAASTYALIAIGDGLVSQIPSLTIAVAAGLVVTRVGSEQADDTLGADIARQFFGRAPILWVVSGVCGALALVPGMPHLTFAALAAGAGVVGWHLRSRSSTPAQPQTPEPEANAAPESTFGGPSPLVLDLSPELDALVHENNKAFIRIDLQTLRDRIFVEFGVRLPSFRVRTGAPSSPRSYALSIDEVPTGRGVVPEADCFVLAPSSELQAAGIEHTSTQDALGRTICAVNEPKSLIEQRGFPTRSARELLIDHLAQLLRKRAASFLGIQEVSTALTELESHSPALVKEALQKVPLPLMVEVLRRLLQEQVSIRNLRQLLEALVSPSTEGDAAQLAERCRLALSRQISHQFAQGGPLFAWLVDPAVEETLRKGGQALDPKDASAILEGARRVCRQGKGVLLSSPDVRRVLRRLVEGAFPELAVLTFSELDPELQVRPVGRLVAVPNGAN